jgi:nucleotide-binding universal stress UspA family protein
MDVLDGSGSAVRRWHAPCEVLAHKKGALMQPRILVPYDFSPAAERALAWAQDLKQSVGGGSIHLLYVMSSLPALGATSGLSLSVPCEEDLDQLEVRLRDVAARCDPETTTEAVLGNDIAEKVMATGSARGTQLIVMGTHGHGGVKRLVLGSVADFVVRNADCPVVTIRESAE